MITFSLRPISGSTLPLIAASVRTFVVSWNEAAERNELVASDALVIPRIIGVPVAFLLPSSSSFSLTSVNSRVSTCEPGKKSESPADSITIFLSICLTISSICLSLISTP